MNIIYTTSPNDIFIWVIIFALLVVAIFVFFKIFNNYVSIKSDSLQKLYTINHEFEFYDITDKKLNHSYDNEAMYKDITPKDYLTYELQFMTKEIKKDLDNAKKNQIKYAEYLKKIKEECVLGSNTENVKMKFLFLMVEKRLFKKYTLEPKTTYSIYVRLVLRNMADQYKSSKNKVFSATEIYDIIYKLSKKNGKFYLVPEVWESICRVERGRVSNKMRFSIYQRDNYRCRKCGYYGKNTRNLEIDHIYPIAKGGKSTYDNLQTLCSRCNKIKGANVE